MKYELKQQLRREELEFNEWKKRQEMHSLDFNNRYLSGRVDKLKHEKETLQIKYAVASFVAIAATITLAIALVILL